MDWCPTWEQMAVVVLVAIVAAAIGMALYSAAREIIDDEDDNW